MSLNADDEYRRKEKRLTLLRERSILKSEERYRISSREEVVRRLDKEFGITMIEQKNSQRMQ
jgi:ribosome-binding protein aMBF1 (putative translation factor)